jgi:hypothetical protein
MDDHKRPSMAMAQALGVAPHQMAIAAHRDTPFYAGKSDRFHPIELQESDIHPQLNRN